jgi:hypothetical protein
MSLLKKGQKSIYQMLENDGRKSLRWWEKLVILMIVLIAVLIIVLIFNERILEYIDIIKEWYESG